MIGELKALELSGAGQHFGIVASRYNAAIVDRLVDSAIATLEEHQAEAIDLVHVPGAFEIPAMAKRLITTQEYDALLALGCVIRGQTQHYDLIVNACSQGIMQVMLETGVPITYGVLAVNTRAEAEQRAQAASEMNRGREAALAAVEMAQLFVMTDGYEE